MPSYSVTNKSGRKGSWDIKAGRKYTEIFEVISSVINDTAANVTSPATTGYALPTAGSVHPGDAGAIVVAISAVQNEGAPHVWRLEYTYDTHPDFPWGAQGQSPTNQPQNPLTRLPIIERGFRTEKISVLRDLDNDALINSALQPYPDGVERDIDIVTIDITVCKADDDYSLLGGQQNITNQDTWTLRGVDFDPYTVRAFPPKVVGKWDNNISYFEWHWHLEVAPACAPYFGQFLYTYVLESGFYERIDGKLVAIKDKDGLQISKPHLLDNLGRKTTSPWYQPYRLTEKVDFTGLIP